MSIKVSIIVPVYNTENYLTRCLESLVNQSLKDIEIIVINDCSTDNSLTILEKYKQKYTEKIIIINLKENRGPGGARNEGIRKASGDYLGFVDSDDDVSLEMFQELYKVASLGDYDMVDCQFYHEDLNKNMKTTSESAFGELTIEKRKELFVHCGFIWSKIIRRNIIIDNNIKFRENVAYEDIDFLRIPILYFKKIYASNMTLYNHRNNTTSITNCCTRDIQVYQKMNSMRSLVNKFKDLDAYIEYKDEITYLIYKTYVIMLDYVVTQDYVIEKGEENINFEVIKEIHDFFFDVVDYDYQANKYILQMDEEDRMFAEIINNS